MIVTAGQNRAWRKRPPSRYICAAIAVLSAQGLRVEQAAALGADGTVIDTSDYTIDLHTGPVQGGPRMVGLAGAYEAVAEGVVGYQYNPASVAHRLPWSQEWFDFEVDGGVTLPASLTNFDFDNNGDSEFTNSAALFATAGLGAQFGEWGLGVSLDYQLYQVGSTEESDLTLNITVLRLLLVGGRTFLKGELSAGIGIGANTIDIEQALPFGSDDMARQIGGVTGATLHLGLLWAPAYAPVRIGASARLAPPAAWQPDARPDCVAPECQQIGDDFISQGFFLPRTITLPNEVYLGVGVQLLRPFNLSWVNPRDEPSAAAKVEEQNALRRKQRREAQQKEHERRKQAGADERVAQRAFESYDQSVRAAEDRQLEAAQKADRQRRLKPYKEQPRPRVLLLVGGKMTWSTALGVGLESFLERRVERSGQQVTFQPHGAVEAEMMPGYVVVRGGSYLEPSRFRAGSSRAHGTGGLDVRIPIEWSVFGLLDDDTTFRVSGAVDRSARYFGWGVGAGIWR